MKYERNFLSQVVLRIDYPRVADIASERRPALMASVAEDFPQITGLPQAQIQFTVALDRPVVDQRIVGYTWFAKDDTGNKCIELTTESLSLMNLNRSFTNFDDFFGQFSEIYESFEDTYQVNEFTRVGLRYINQVDLDQGNALDWNGYLSDEVIHATISRIPERFALSRSMHQVVSSHNDVTLVANYGIHNPDFPAPAVRRQFILDFDCYITGAVNRDAMLRRVADLNDVCENAFEASIEARLRDAMGVVRD